MEYVIYTYIQDLMMYRCLFQLGMKLNNYLKWLHILLKLKRM